MAKDFSPEERLLHLIKGKRKGPLDSEEAERPGTEEKKEISKEDEKIILSAEEKKTVSREDERVAPSEIKKQTEKEKRPPHEGKPPERVKTKLSKRPKVTFNVRYLYILSGVALLSLIAPFIFSILSNKEKQELEGLERLVATVSEEARVENPPAKKVETPQEEKMPPESPEQKPEVSFEEYQKLLLKKSIFAPPATDRKKSPVSEGPTLRELVKDLRLVGIMPGDEPQVIIEDKKSGQTLFLKKGEQIEGIEIKEIQSGRVILGYEEETITLSL